MTDARQLIARQMVRSGSTLMLAMEPVPGDAFYAENANGFSAAWAVGHMACVTDLFTSWFGGGLLLGGSFHRVFNDTSAAEPCPVSKAALVDRDRYPKAFLLRGFQEAVIRALRALAAFDIGQWDVPGPPGVPVSLRTGGDVWEVLAVHVYWHCGELAGSMPMFFGTYALNTVPHYFYDPEEA